MNLALLSPKVWLEIAVAAILAGGIWYAYSWAYDLGAQHTQIAWDKEKAELTAAALKASETNRIKEQQLNLSIQRLTNDYSRIQKLNADNGASLDRVQHNFEAALNSRCNANPGAPGCANGAGGLEQELLGTCAGALVELSKTADRLESKVVGLQDYIKSTR